MNSRHRVIFLFAHPRSVSTAFERIIIEHGDFIVLHEPFSQMYYHHYQKKPAVGSTSANVKDYQQIKEDIKVAVGSRDVLIKDMAYHVLPQILEDVELLTDPRNVFTFLIRDPRKAISSHYKINSNVSFEELGYEALHSLYDRLVKLNRDVYIVDADDLERDSEGTVNKYCTVIGTDFDKDSLSWEKDSAPEEWNSWAPWHVDAAESTGIHLGKKEYHGDKEKLFPQVAVDDRDRIIEYYLQCLDYYQRLTRARLSQHKHTIGF